MKQGLKLFSTAVLLIAACIGPTTANDRIAQPASTNALSGVNVEAGQPKAALAEGQADKEAKKKADQSVERAAPAVTDTDHATPTSKSPRRPDTAGWRRIMAGAGRT